MNRKRAEEISLALTRLEDLEGLMEEVLDLVERRTEDYDIAPLCIRGTFEEKLKDLFKEEQKELLEILEAL